MSTPRYMELEIAGNIVYVHAMGHDANLTNHPELEKYRKFLKPGEILYIAELGDVPGVWTHLADPDESFDDALDALVGKILLHTTPENRTAVTLYEWDHKTGERAKTLQVIWKADEFVYCINDRRDEIIEMKQDDLEKAQKMKVYDVPLNVTYKKDLNTAALVRHYNSAGGYDRGAVSVHVVRYEQGSILFENVGTGQAFVGETLQVHTAFEYSPDERPDMIESFSVKDYAQKQEFLNSAGSSVNPQAFLVRKMNNLGMFEMGDIIARVKVLNCYYEPGDDSVYIEFETPFGGKFCKPADDIVTEYGFSPMWNENLITAFSLKEDSSI